VELNIVRRESEGIN